MMCAEILSGRRPKEAGIFVGETSIEWTTSYAPDGTKHPGFTFNPWVGCEKIGPGCMHCYAASWASRTGQSELWNGARRRTTSAYWNQPLKWNAQSEKDGIRRRVFCASLADVFDTA